VTWLSLALALVQLVNYVFGKLDAAAKDKAVRALVEQENLKADMEAIARANDARSAVERGLANDPDSLRSADPDSRT